MPLNLLKIGMTMRVSADQLRPPLGNSFHICSHCRMMIRPDNEELTRAIEIALSTAQPYALRGVFTPTRALNRQIAIQTLSQRIIAALRRYEITREPLAHEQGDQTLPLFPDAEI